MVARPAVRLRQVLPSDLPIHFEQQRDPESSRLAAVTPRDRAAFDAHWDAVLADPANVARTIVCGDDVVGSAVAFPRDGARHVGYWIARDRWGEGIASAALPLLLEELRERPLFATVAVHNTASLRVLEKAGFRRCGQEQHDDALLHVLRLD